jgi:hypothetical protein
MHTAWDRPRPRVIHASTLPVLHEAIRRLRHAVRRLRHAARRASVPTPRHALCRWMLMRAMMMSLRER